jgi:hypothetical protein
VRLLLDECVPRKFKDALSGHDASTAQELGWSGKRNGEVLRLMREHRFDVFITVDQNVGFQQNVAASGIAVVVLAARSNRLKDLLPLVAGVLKKLSQIKPGAVERVSS